MKIGIISDIHSNIVALKACIEYMESAGCGEYLFLGDYVSDTPYTRETLDYLYDFVNSHKCQLLRGNREDYMLRQRQVIAENITQERWTWNSASGNLLFAYEQLEERDFAFFERLPIMFRYQREECPAITCCHGSPASSRERLCACEENTRNWLGKIDTDYLICAHTHRPEEWNSQRKHYYNPGSVGIAIGDFGLAQCMILEAVEADGKAEWKPSFLKIPYDAEHVVQDICRSGQLDKGAWFVNANIHILRTGIDMSAEIAELASKLSAEGGEKEVWPLIKEKYWEAAAKQLSIPDYRKER